MIKIFKKSLVFFCLVFLLSCLNVKAYANYTIDKFDIDIKVNENNTYEIKEIIDVNFKASVKEFNITIPRSNYIDNKIKSKVKITNLKVNDTYELINNKDNYQIKLGEAIEGKKQYIISYTYEVSYNNSIYNKFEGFYYNLVGQDWDALIYNVDFKVSLPNNYSDYNVSFKSKEIVQSDEDKFKYEIKDNVITGTSTKIFAGDLILIISLPVKLASNDLTKLCMLVFFIPIICLGIAILIWYKKGKDEIIETVEFYPPKEINSLEMGFLNDGLVDEKNVLSLLIYLANKGYLKIKEENDDYKFIKLKEYDGNKKEEKMFLDALFEKSHKNEEEFVYKSELDTDFSYRIKEIINSMHSRANYRKIYERTTFWHFITVLLYIISIIATVFPLMNIIEFTIFGFDEIKYMENILFIIIGIAIGTRIICIENLLPKVRNIFLIIGIGIFMIIFFNLYEILLYNSFVIIVFIVGLISSIGIIICYSYLDKRTEEASKMVGRIRGFKRFLETVERDRLESLLNDDPDYFFKILPYAYVLELSDKWIKDFEDIVLPESPQSKEFDIYEILLDDCMPSLISLVAIAGISLFNIIKK